MTSIWTLMGKRLYSSVKWLGNELYMHKIVIVSEIFA